MQPAQAYQTSRLFSESYLEEHLPETDAWDDLDDEALRAARDRIVELWERESEPDQGRTDSRREASFVQSVFRALGLPVEVEERAGRTHRLLDCGSLESEAVVRGAAECREGGDDFCGDAVAVVEVKRRGRPLDALAGDEWVDEPGNPSYQMHVNLQETPVRWGVLTDGRTWRLYCEPTSHRLDSYYEIDLPTLLEAGDLEDFRYFYLFFGHGAFVEDADGDCFLDDVYAESSEFTRELGERLRENVREAVEVLAAGFLQYPDNELTEDDLDCIHEGSLVYLYRLLFVLYAESAERELRPIEESDAESDGLDGLKRDVGAGADDENPSYCGRDADLWWRLDELFGLVQGNTPHDGPGSELDVPAHAGRLFRSEAEEDDDRETRFLATNRVSDAHLAEVVGLLTRCQHDPGDEERAVDYAALDVRHLGDIYEYLLEYELEIAAEPLTRDGGEYAPAREGDDVVVAEEEAHLTAGSGRRRATGTYYTPEYVVEYIVEQTVEPLVEEIRERLHDRPSDDGGFAEAFAERVFELDIVDPAMGSGHFLTSAVDYLTCEIVGAQERQAVRAGVESVDETRDVGRIRRQVVRHCLYGVDLNPFAVELAKASLWLRTADAERPPAPLDQQLKAGNALVGSGVDEIEELEPVAGSGETATASGEFETDERRRRSTATANVHTAGKFGLDGLPDDAAGRMAASLDDDEAWERIERTQWFQAAQERAASERFFHWTLAYPEVFSDGSGDEQADAGFDAVIGNPPYVRSRELPEAYRTFYRQQYRSAEGAYDVYVPFMELATELGDQVSFVVPNKWTTTGYGRSLRELLLDECTLHELVDVSHLDVFPGAEIYPVVVSYSSARAAEHDGPTVRHVETPENIDGTAGVTISREIVEQLGDRVIPVNLTAEFVPILEKALARESRFGDHVVTTEAIHTGNVREKLVVEEDVDESCEKLADGRSIDRYRVEWSGEWIRYDDGLVDPDRGEYADLRARDRFDRDEKLFLRDISYRPVAAYDDRQLFGLNTLYSVTRSDSSDCSLKYLLAIFNSEFVNRYFRQVYGGTHVGGDYLRFKPTFTDEIPVPEPSAGGLPDGHERRIAGFDPTVDTSSTVAAIEDLTDRIREAMAVKRSLNLDLVGALGDYSSGPQLGELAGYRPVAGAARSPLADTARSREKLRVGSVEIREDDGTLSLWASARYKPDEEGDRRTDRWGYVETDLLPAVEFVGLSGGERLLVREFVPAAVEEAGGFADFRETATKTTSLLDRLERITLPAVADVRGELERYRKDVRTAARMDERIEGADGLLDDIVYDLYDLTAEQKATVEALGE